MSYGYYSEWKHLIPKATDVDCICLHCVSDGSAAAKFHGDFIDDADSCNEVENLYNDYILAGQMSVIHDSQIYKAKYQAALADWIFAADRQLGDKILIEVDGTFYVIYFISESPNPEWYDMVNSFLSMNNLQQFIQSKAGEYIWKFNNDGLAQIKDVP